jgi:hypothetical protein
VCCAFNMQTTSCSRSGSMSYTNSCP